MTWSEIIVVITLALIVVTAWLCCLGLTAMRSPYDRLHAIGPANILAPVLLVIAVFAQTGFSQALLKTSVIALVLLFTAPIVTHAIARAARMRETGKLAAEK